MHLVYLFDAIRPDQIYIQNKMTILVFFPEGISKGNILRKSVIFDKCLIMNATHADFPNCIY